MKQTVPTSLEIQKVFQNPLPLPSLEDRVKMHLEDETYVLLLCPDAWALRHQFVNKATGETIRARCNSWVCAYCGPRKVDEWRQVIQQAEPVLHLVLTKAGKTIEQASRALTTFMQALRRGSRGRGRGHIGARPAYPVEYFAVLERHENFEEVGFHWHILLKGVDRIPYKEVIKPLWMSATHYNKETGQGAENGWIDRVDRGHAIGYVTKYLTKDILREEKGVKEIKVSHIVMRVGPDGRLLEEKQTETKIVESHARRIRYSRAFFPESVKAMRERLFSRAEEEGETGVDAAVMPEKELTEGEWEVEEKPVSMWELRERYTFTHDPHEHIRRVRETLHEVVSERVAGNKRLSRRVVTIWNYQRDRWRKAG